MQVYLLKNNNTQNPMATTNPIFKAKDCDDIAYSFIIKFLWTCVIAKKFKFGITEYKDYVLVEFDFNKVIKNQLFWEMFNAFIGNKDYLFKYIPDRKVYFGKFEKVKVSNFKVKKNFFNDFFDLYCYLYEKGVWRDNHNNKYSLYNSLNEYDLLTNEGKVELDEFANRFKHVDFDNVNNTIYLINITSPIKMKFTSGQFAKSMLGQGFMPYNKHKVLLDDMFFLVELKQEYKIRCLEWQPQNSIFENMGTS